MVRNVPNIYSMNDSIVAGTCHLDTVDDEDHGKDGWNTGDGTDH